MSDLVCLTCKDTHRMPLDEREVPCTFCPRPCETCRGIYQGARLGAYCETTPCACSCHVVTARTKPENAGSDLDLSGEPAAMVVFVKKTDPHEKRLNAVLQACREANAWLKAGHDFDVTLERPLGTAPRAMVEGALRAERNELAKAKAEVARERTALLAAIAEIHSRSLDYQDDCARRGRERARRATGT